MKDMLHFGIALIHGLVDIQNLTVTVAFIRLVKDAQYLHQTIVHVAMKERNLNDDAVMDKTLYKGIWHSFLNFITVIIVRLVADIQDRFFYLSHPVSQKINGYHRDAIAVWIGILNDIIRVGILRAKVLAKT